MASLEGHESWQVQEYSSIEPKTSFSYLSVFADTDENLFLPGSNWDLHFSEKDGITTLQIKIFNESRERMEQMMEMGFQEGLTMTLNELVNLLETLKK